MYFREGLNMRTYLVTIGSDSVGQIEAFSLVRPGNAIILSDGELLVCVAFEAGEDL